MPRRPERQFKVQCGFAAVQSSKFSDLKVQSDPRVDDKVINDYELQGLKLKFKVMKKETWKTLIQILVSILTAIGTTLGVTSCMGYGPIAMLQVPDGEEKGRHPVGMPFFLSPICPQVGGESQKLLGILIFHPCHRDSWRWLQNIQIRNEKNRSMSARNVTLNDFFGSMKQLLYTVRPKKLTFATNF